MNFIIQKDEYFSTLFVDPGPSFVNATNITNISDSVIKFQNIIIDSATFVPEPVPTGNDLPLGIQKKLFLDDFDDQLKLIDSNGNIEFTSFDQNLNTNSAVEFQLLATNNLFTSNIKGNGTSSLNIDDFSNIDLTSSGDVEFTGKITGTELEVTNNNIKVVAGNIEVVTGSITAVGAGASIVGNGLTTTTNGLNVAGGNISITGGGSIGTNSNTSDIGTSSQPFACIFAENINLNDLPDSDPSIPGQLYKDSNSFVKISI